MNPNPRADKTVSRYKFTVYPEGFKKIENSIIERVEKLHSGPALCNLSRTKMASFKIDSRMARLEPDLPN